MTEVRPSVLPPSRWVLWVLLLTGAVVVCAAPFFGAVSISPRAMIQGDLDETAHHILWGIRIPRVVIAFGVGGVLGLGGLVFQTVFRNVLATPYTLGVSSGAALGAAVYFKAGVAFSLGGMPGSMGAALLGALVVVILVDRIAARHVPTTTILLTGVVVALFSGSLISFLEYMSGFNAVFQLSRWLMGGLESVSLVGVVPILPIVAVCMVLVALKAGELNILALGDELARGRGVDVERVRRTVLVSVSVMVGGVVAFAGPIGFVGMMVPQTLRLIVGADNRLLVPATVLGGGAFLVICDTIARTVAAPYEVPVGIVTALLGGPYFLWLLLKRERSPNLTRRV